MRGRPRKAQLNDVVVWEATQQNGYSVDKQHKHWQFGVVVDYRDDTKWGRYLVIRTDPLGRSPHGAAIWVDSTDFVSIGNKTSRTPGRAYRGNERLGGGEMRGCFCNCCCHVRGYEPEPGD